MAELEIVIISWNTLELTRTCLASVYQELAGTGIDARVWVIDNCSSDDSVAMIRTEFPHVALVTNQENVGFARANNQALRQATSPIQLLLNSDTVIHAGAISTLLQVLRTRQEIAAVGPRLVFPDGGVQRSFTRLPSVLGELKYCAAYHFFPFNRVFYWLAGYGSQSWEQERADREVEVLSAACLMVRKKVFESVGVLAEDYFLFSEENDLFCRMKGAGYRSVYAPGAVVTHVVGASRRKRGGLDSHVNFLRSRMIFFQRFHKHSYPQVKMMYRFFLGWSFVTARLIGLLKGNLESEYVVLYRRLLAVLAELKVAS